MAGSSWSRSWSPVRLRPWCKYPAPRNRSRRNDRDTDDRTPRRTASASRRARPERFAMIQQLTGFPPNVVAFACHGHVTAADYDTVLVPAVVNTLRTHDKVRLYYETGADFALDPGAAWEDFKVGMEHFTRWERVAVVTNI